MHIFFIWLGYCYFQYAQAYEHTEKAAVRRAFFHRLVWVSLICFGVGGGTYLEADPYLLELTNQEIVLTVE